MAQISGKTILPFLGIGAVAYFAFAMFIAKDLGDPARANRDRLTADAGVTALSDADRSAYLALQVKVEDFSVAPETRPDSDKRVGGLLRVTGRIVNAGTQAVPGLTVMVLAKDEAGRVLASFQDGVSPPTPIEPNGTRTFAFTIPEKPDYAAFEPKLR